MIEEQAVVVNLEGKRALLEIERSTPCGLCGATRGCGVSLWGRLFSRSRPGVSASNSLDAKVGDHVIIGVEEGALLSGSIAAYLLPIALIFLGAFAGAAMAASRTASDFYAVGGAVVGLVLGLVWVKFYTAKQQGGRYEPVMLRRAESIPVRHCSR